MVNFDEFLKTLTLRSNSVTRQVTFDRKKIGANTKIEKFQYDIFDDDGGIFLWAKGGK